MTDKLINIIRQFSIDGVVVTINPFGSGHINDTYKVVTSENDYLLQRINHLVFRDVEGLMQNLIAVTEFLSNKIENEDCLMHIPKSIPSFDDKFHIRDEKGNWWRVFEFIQESFSYDRVTSNDIAYEGGRSYGWFVKTLDDFRSDGLVETIPGFHNASFRIKNFKKAVDNDIAGRVSGVKTLVDDLMDRSDSMMLIHNLGKSGQIPVRVTHNDTKINNVLFNKQNKGMCVIDLDTVMPGYVHFDFGDAIRTFTNSANEDEKERGKVSMNLNYYTAFTDGFLSETQEILTKEELETLAFSAKYITYEQAIRFFTDYLEGDQYYKINFPEHNLIRTQSQVWLLQSMEAQATAMERVFSKSISSK